MSNKGLGQLERLTLGERLLIDRRRRSEDQSEAAKQHGVTRTVYGTWERDVVAGPAVKIGALEPYERCLLYRRRAGSTQEIVATGLERCRWWINKMESGEVDCTELMCYWEC